MVRIISFLLCICSLPGWAQTFVGLKGGLNISDIVMTNYVNPDVESDLRLKTGVHGGFFIIGNLDERVGFAGELLYSDKGVKGNSNIHLHYFSLPLLATYRLTEKLYAEAGPELAYMMSATSEFGNASSTYNNKFDLSLDAGVRFDAGKVIFGLRYCAGVFSVSEPFEVQSSSGPETVKYQNRVLQISLGYKLRSLELRPQSEGR